MSCSCNGEIEFRAKPLFPLSPRLLSGPGLRLISPLSDNEVRTRKAVLSISRILNNGALFGEWGTRNLRYLHRDQLRRFIERNLGGEVVRQLIEYFQVSLIYSGKWYLTF